MNGAADSGPKPIRTRNQQASTYARYATGDRDEAERVITQLYLPNRLDLSRDQTPLRMEVSGLRVGALTAGRIAYGRNVRLRTADAEHFHVNIPLRGRAVSRAGTSEPTPTGPGEGLVFSPGAPADISWSADCEQLCLMIPQARLEEELEHLLGRSVRGGLVFDFAADLRGALGRRWRTTLDLLADELDAPTDLVSNPLIGRHVEALVLDGLLLGQRHNHSETAWRDGPAGLGGPVRQAIELIEERASEPWTTVRLAAAVHLSVRALQEGFRRDLGSTPMTYLREIRLRRAREALTEAEPTDMTVRAVAVNVGILHMSRFAAAYREAFGEMPSETLNRPN